MDQNILDGVWPGWKIVRLIGKGAHGSVYEAVRTEYQVENHAAVKVISIPQNEAELDSLLSDGLTQDETKTYLENVVNDFVSEIQLMESLKGTQNIVSVEDYKVVEKKGQVGWDIYLRMELLTPFNTYIRDKQLSEKDVRKLGCDICNALELCSKRNVIHRDIKPENIFVNDFGDFKLGDFGIARKLDNVAGGLSKKGTYNYMAPEIEKGLQYDATVDLYSLGLVLYRLMNHNRLPFIETEEQVLNPNARMAATKRRLNGEPLPAPSEASPGMVNVILRACSPEPAMRFSSAQEMKNALMNVDSGDFDPEDDYLNKTVRVRRAPKTVQTQSSQPYVQQTAESVNRMPVQQVSRPQPERPAATFGRRKKDYMVVVLLVVVLVELLVAGVCLFLLAAQKNEDLGYDSESINVMAEIGEEENVSCRV